MIDYIELGKRLVACKGFRWIAGMRWRFDLESHKNVWSRYMGADLCDDEGNPVVETSPFNRTTAEGCVLLDLSDPATLGCLLALVRATFRDDTIYVPFFRDENKWCVSSGRQFGGSVRIKGECMLADSEVEALVVALEAVP